MGVVQQSGNVTPGHIATWTTDGVAQDGGMPIPAVNAMLAASVLQVNFNAGNTDNPINIGLPQNYTQYRIHQIIIEGATASLSTATCGVFTQQGAGGLAVVAGNTAVTITQTAGDTNNNMQALTIANQNTLALIDPTLYFRVQNPQGSSALANVIVFYQPIP